MYFSTTGMILRPIFWASMAISMYSSSLKPLQMMGVSLSARAMTAMQLGLGAGFQAEAEGLAEFEDLFDHLALLVDLDGIDAAVAALVLVLGDGGLEGAVDFAEAVLQDVGEADEDGEVDAAQDQRVDQFLEVDGARGILLGVDEDVSVVAHRKVALAPTGDVVEVAGRLRGPSFRRLHDEGALAAISFQRGASPLILQFP